MVGGGGKLCLRWWCKRPRAEPLAQRGARPAALLGGHHRSSVEVRVAAPVSGGWDRWAAWLRAVPPSHLSHRDAGPRSRPAWRCSSANGRERQGSAKQASPAAGHQENRYRSGACRPPSASPQSSPAGRRRMGNGGGPSIPSPTHPQPVPVIPPSHRLHRSPKPPQAHEQHAIAERLPPRTPLRHRPLVSLQSQPPPSLPAFSRLLQMALALHRRPASGNRTMRLRRRSVLDVAEVDPKGGTSQAGFLIGSATGSCLPQTMACIACC